MFESIIEKVPELRKLERAVEALQQEHGEASARVAALANKVAQAREDDLNREAVALNNGRKAPKPKCPNSARNSKARSVSWRSSSVV
jgi:hypothetical protein